MGTYRDRIYGAYASGFKGVGQTFDRARAERAGRAYRHYFRGWWPDDRSVPVLDLACGDGTLLYLAKQLGFTSVSGVDLSPEQVALARQVPAEVELGDGTAYLKRHPGRFGLITAIDVIEHLTKDEVFDLLDAARLALRPGGRLVLQTPNAAAPFGMAVRYGDFTHEQAFTPGVLGRLLTMTGFSTPEAREMGPIPRGYSLTSTLRAVLWQGLSLGCTAWHMIETGSRGDGIYTRVFAISAVRSP